MCTGGINAVFADGSVGSANAPAKSGNGG
ncbi:H-X9-DG-CTERM domain-containing protein [Sphingopyxis sp. Root1497]